MTHKFLNSSVPFYKEKREGAGLEERGDTKVNMINKTGMRGEEGEEGGGGGHEESGETEMSTNSSKGDTVRDKDS